MRADAVFEGGGVKGIALVGALEEAERIGYRWVHVAGTSAGAIVAALVAAGYRARELSQLLWNLDWGKVCDRGALGRIPVVGLPLNLLFRLGMYEGDYLAAWLTEKLEKRGVRTFGDLMTPKPDRDRHAGHRYRLQVIASDLTNGRMLVLPGDARRFGIEPERLSVAYAVRMSMSIPFFFEPCVLRSKGRQRRRNIIVDGGLLSNFPVWLYDVPSRPRWPTFGFRLIEPDFGEPRKIHGPISMMAALFSTMMEAHDARHIAEQDWVRTIGIPTLGVKATDFNIDDETKAALYESGRTAARDFFSGWSFRTYAATFRDKERPDDERERGSVRERRTAQKTGVGRG